MIKNRVNIKSFIEKLCFIYAILRRFMLKTKQATRFSDSIYRLLESGWWRITIIIVILSFNFALYKV